MEKRNFNGVEVEVFKGKTTNEFALVNGVEFPLNKNGLTKKFMKDFIKATREVNTIIWFKELCEKSTEIKHSKGLNRDVEKLDIEKVRGEFIKKIELNFLYEKKTQYKTYLDELDELDELIKELEEEKVSA